MRWISYPMGSHLHYPRSQGSLPPYSLPVTSTLLFHLWEENMSETREKTGHGIQRNTLVLYQIKVSKILTEESQLYW